MKKHILDLLEERGLIDQMTSPDLREHLLQPRNVYIGFDPTADSLHVGHLVPIIVLEWFRRAGHIPYVILGGATGRVGDPKSTERPLLKEEVLQENVKSLERFFRKIFVHGKQEPVILNNDAWFCKFTLIDFLRDVGKFFRVGQMLAKESVKARLQSEEGLSFTEFSYQILQGYDFAYLNSHYGLTLQMGGSDQWGNITSGIEYNRKIGGGSLFGLTFPLVTKSDGKKFGKSEEGAVWLSQEKLSPYQFYQYFMKISDTDVVKLLGMLTFLDISEIRHLEQQMKEPDYVPNTLQKRLAEEVTRFVHQEEGLSSALKVTEGILPGSSANLTGSVLENLMGEMPSADLSKEKVVGCKLIELLVEVKLASSKAEASRLIANGGIYLNNLRMENAQYILLEKDLIEKHYVLLSVGKKRRFLVRAVD